MGSILQTSVASGVRLYEVGVHRPAAGDDDDDTDGAADEVRGMTAWSASSKLPPPP